VTGILPYQRSYATYRRRLRRIRRRLRGGGGGGIPAWLMICVAVVAGVAAISATGAAGHAVKGVTQAAGGVGGARHATTDAQIRVPSGSDLSTPAGFARALLAADSLPLTACNLNAITAWEHAEGGGFGNQASFNPLNVNPPATAPWPGHHAIGAWAFPDAPTGLKYTVQTLNNGYYGGILAALRAGNDAGAVVREVKGSPWAKSHYAGNRTFTASC
jgi:hypothetical protein